MNRTYSAVFFDLDGTLLPMEIDVFLSRYFGALEESAVGAGFPPNTFSQAVGDSVKAMCHHEPGMLNIDAFWRAMGERLGKVGEREARFLDYFYAERFPLIGQDTQPNPAAARAVEAVAGKGYTLCLATMPLFPPEAVRARLRWAGVDPTLFSRITCATNSTSVKPKLDYYQENLDFFGLSGESVLMVGNNAVEDLAAMELGADAFLVTDYLINPNGLDVDTVRHGTLADFAAFAEALPECEGTACGVAPAAPPLGERSPRV